MGSGIILPEMFLLSMADSVYPYGPWTVYLRKSASHIFSDLLRALHGSVSFPYHKLATAGACSLSIPISINLIRDKRCAIHIKSVIWKLKS